MSTRLGIIISVLALGATLAPRESAAPNGTLGIVRAERTARIAAEIEGRVVKRHLEEHQSARAGQVVFELDDTLRKAAVKAAEAGLKDTRSLLVDAQSDHAAELEQLAASHGKKFASTKRKCEQLEANAVQAARAMKQSDDNLKTVTATSTLLARP